MQKGNPHEEAHHRIAAARFPGSGSPPDHEPEPVVPERPPADRGSVPALGGMLMTDPAEIARIAAIIASAMGDNFADAFENSTHWIVRRGMNGGRFRDVNEPYQADYIAAAEAVAEYLKEQERGQ